MRIAICDFLTLGHSFAFSCFLLFLLYPYRIFGLIQIQTGPNNTILLLSSVGYWIFNILQDLSKIGKRYSCDYGNIQAHLHNNIDNLESLTKNLKQEYVNHLFIYTS